MTLNEVLEAVRDGKIRQRELASKAGVSQPTISNLVTGTSASTSHANALAIMNAAKELLPELEESPTNG